MHPSSALILSSTLPEPSFESMRFPLAMLRLNRRLTGFHRHLPPTVMPWPLYVNLLLVNVTSWFQGENPRCIYGSLDFYPVGFLLASLQKGFLSFRFYFSFLFLPPTPFPHVRDPRAINTFVLNLTRPLWCLLQHAQMAWVVNLIYKRGWSTEFAFVKSSGVVPTSLSLCCCLVADRAQL